MTEANHVDNSGQITHLSFCAGYGGIDLGLKRAIPSLRTITYVEIEAFAVANLVEKINQGSLDAAPLYTDLRTFPGEMFRDRVDCISGGYPCQPFSQCGNRKGEDDPRHLWPAIKRAIATVRPRFCFFENVEGHLTLGLKNVLFDLGELGFKCAVGLFTAEEVGAPHQRKRLFILANRNGTRLERHICDASPEGRKKAGRYATRCGEHRGEWPARPNERQHEWEEPRVVGNTDATRKSQPQRRKQAFGGWHSDSSAELANAEGSNEQGHGSRPRERQLGGKGAEQGHGSESQLGRATDGPSGWVDANRNRIDRLRMLGNGVVPQTAEIAFRTLLMELEE
ncbi:MAG: DNA cytosine methyltransferase [Rhizobiaceae bacterium]|nr:DNA cytosine methyltransferase [Rhizobiaceae bacterium]